MYVKKDSGGIMKKDKKIIKKDNVKKEKSKRSSKDWNKILLISLLVLLALEIVLIPCLVYAEVKKVLPIVSFLILPTLCGVVVLLLSRNCTIDYQKKKERLSKRNVKVK